MSELSLSTVGSEKEISHEFLSKIYNTSEELFIDAENKNFLDPLREDTIGYEKLGERIKNPNSNKDLAYEDVFAELLGKYYVDKRKDIKSAAKLFDQLNQDFSPSSLEPIDFNQDGISSTIQFGSKKNNQNAHLMQVWNQSFMDNKIATSRFRDQLQLPP
jgi:hypothetical protein